ncbi:unnamed protein product [Calicophoron daubneyi]|uniref:Uncharacterized protein n=1 Tax=Calicophoron daubneyi TaxID=300641 RepID=A0AAV2U1M9_CALDB
MSGPCDMQPRLSIILTVLITYASPASASSTFLGLPLWVSISGCTFAAVFLLILVGGLVWMYRHKSPVDPESSNVSKRLSDEIYQPGDKNLAASAQRYHFLFQKQQMLTQMKDVGCECDNSVRSDSTGKEIIYSCPGLASIESIQIENPVFNISERDCCIKCS